MEPSPTIARRLRGPSRGQSGVSLIEVLVGVAIMVPLTLVSLSGMLVQMRVSANTKETQELEVALGTAAEDVRSVPYLRCATADDYQKAYEQWTGAMPTRVAPANAPTPVVVTTVRYWNERQAAFVPECSGDDGAQQLFLKASGTERPVRASVVKRNSDARKAESG